MSTDDQTYVWQRLRMAGMWVFLAPLILILGTVDLLTHGRSRAWPLRDAPPDDEPR